MHKVVHHDDVRNASCSIINQWSRLLCCVELCLKYEPSNLKSTAEIYYIIKLCDISRACMESGSDLDQISGYEFDL